MEPHRSPSQMNRMINFILLSVMALGLLGNDCEGEKLGHKEAIQLLESRLTVGMPRDEIEAFLTETGLRHHYVSRDHPAAMYPEPDQSKGFSGRFYVFLPEDKGLLFKTVGELLIDLDADERMVDFRIQRGKVPR